MITSIRILIPAVSALALAGCLLDEKPPAKKPVDARKPVNCTALCRVEFPEDTLALTPDQKEQLIDLIESADDSAVVTLASVDVAALGDTGTRLEALKDLQTDLLKDMQIPLDPAVISSLPIDSLLATVQVTASLDGTVNLQWSGSLADVSIEKVSLNIKGGEFLGGYAVVEGKLFQLQPLGGNHIALVYDSKMIWMGECPPLPKSGRAQLSCALP